MPTLRPRHERHRERHRTDRIGWLRAAVLGANDGVISTASLVVGVAAAGTGSADLLVTGIAGLVAGAMSMAAGEYVSVHSQADTEQADLARERLELEADPVAEQRELAALYAARGLTSALASEVAGQLMAHDALGARPVQAALASAASFAVGAALPLAVTALAAGPNVIAWVSGTALALLAVLGGVAAQIGGASVSKGAWRVTFWGAIAMAVTAAAGSVFDHLLALLR
jgi:vacuolar iron transporter family protein